MDTRVLQNMLGMLSSESNSAAPQTPMRRCTASSASPTPTRLYTPSEAANVANAGEAGSPALPSTQELMDMISDEEFTEPKQGRQMTKPNSGSLQLNVDMLTMLLHWFQGVWLAAVPLHSLFVPQAIKKMFSSRLLCR